MWAGVREGLRLGTEHWAWLVPMACVVVVVWLLRREIRALEAERRRGARAQEELEAYTQLDARIPADGDIGKLARKVCRAVAEKSAFHRAAMLARDSAGVLTVAGSKGMDDYTLAALRAWADQWVERERGIEPKTDAANEARGRSGLGMRLTSRSFAVVLGNGLAGAGRAIVIPLWTSSGRMLGALALCADGLLSVRRSAVAEALIAVEALTAKLARSMENAALAERLIKAEKLAGLGLLAGGVAHALNNPLTAVLGFAELIADTTSEARVHEDAETIVREAKRMRETVASLANYWQPPAGSDEVVEVPALLRGLLAECEGKLERRGIRLSLEMGEAAPVVRGNKERLRQVMEHLLNNAAQAVGEAREMGVASPLTEDGAVHSIRVTVSHDERMLHLIVSDTGPGFSEPERVFDPFYIGVETGHSARIGLSVCHGIVREHGGEISAFNLHPHGAAVMVELPVGGAHRASACDALEVA